VGPYDAFFLPLPIVVVAAAAWRGAEAAASAAGASLPRLVTAALVLFAVLRTARQAGDDRSPGWSRLTTPAARLFLRAPVAGATRAAVSDLALRLPRGSRVTGFPETGFFAYTLDLASATRYEQYFPGHQDGEAEREVIADLAARPPSAVLVANVL